MNSGQTFLYQHLKKKPLSQNTVPIYGLIFELVIKINSKKGKFKS
ncbi:hypothetical protein LEP1GSC018_2253 [Leptospira kirschneri str. 2008720114]|nr:hypothetical protein LEP1GSC018_2253 [Leptospira kirschneri str. 2008720114]